MGIIDKSFIRAPKNYIVQSLLATAVIAVILYALQGLTRGAIVAALGASTFIVFAMPHTIVAQPRRLIGGHTIGLICGSLCYYIFMVGPLRQVSVDWGFMHSFACALSVGLSIFLMTITNTEHPPAAGTALGLVAQEWSYSVVIFVLVCAIGLAIARRLLRFYLRNLFT